MKINWHWPRRPGNYWLPWYRIAWGAVWTPVFIAGRLLTATAVLMGSFSRSAAADELKR